VNLTASIYDPQVEFLEIGVNVNGVQAYKVYGPDLNGSYGGLQGTGGLEATIMNGTGAATGAINDYFGNGVATISGGSVTWNTTKVGGYGPLPDSAATPLTDATQLAQAIIWRGHYIDPTGFYNLGARYYEPVNGRFLSCDPMSFAAGSNLYGFCNGDCVNNFDADGRLWSEIGSTITQTFASAGQTIQSGFAHVAGAVYGDSQAGNEVAGQYSSQAMENSVAGQVLNNGGSLGQAEAATGILGVTLAAEGTLVGGTALFTTGGQTSIFYSGAGALDAANAAAAAGEGVTIGQTTGGVITQAVFGSSNTTAWSAASWFFANAADDSLVLLGEGGGAAGTILGDTELPVLLAGQTDPFLSAGLALLGLGGTAAATHSSCSF
jgi:RHS repeat-associated protein